MRGVASGVLSERPVARGGVMAQSCLIQCLKFFLCVSIARLAFAQDDGPLDEIIVSARSREQALRDVPAAVSVVSDDFLVRNNIGDLDALGDQIPNLVVSKTPFQPVVNLRGMGSGGGTRAFEQSVSTYVDGVYAGRANQFLNPLFDVERIEVIRGPQTVMFGVNAVAGGINIVNKQPGDTLEGFISSAYESEDDGWRIDGAVTLPLAEKLSVRLAARRGLEGGYMDNAFAGTRNPQTDFELYRGTVRWQPTEALTVRFTAEASATEADGTSNQMTSLSPLFRTLFPASIEDGAPDFRKSGHPFNADLTEIDADAFIVNIDWSLGNHTLMSTTGYTQYKYLQEVPAGAVPLPTGTARALEDFDQFYQELRLVSSGPRKIDHIVGITYYEQNFDVFQGIDINLPGVGFPGAPQVAIRNGLQQITRSAAVFSQLTYNFNEDLRAIFGLRYSSVDKDGDYVISTANFGAPLDSYTLDPTSFFVLGGAMSPFGWLLWFDPTDLSTLRPTIYARSKDLDSMDPSVNLQWDVSPNIAAYVSYSEGTKAGGFNDQEKTGVSPENGFASDDFEYQNEEAANYEIGAKVQLDRWRVNAALFYTAFENLQVSQSLGNSVLTNNAASVISKGLELDGVAVLGEKVEVGGDLVLLDSYYEDFPGVGCIFGPDPLNPPPCVPDSTNAAGQSTELSPDVVASLYVQATFPMKNATELIVRARTYYNDGYAMAADHDPIDVMDSYWKHDVSIELASTNGTWAVALQGKNLSDETIIAFGTDAGLNAGHFGYTLPGRQIFLSGRWSFSR
jgi:iron complex outermembrane recepter protein